MERQYRVIKPAKIGGKRRALGAIIALVATLATELVEAGILEPLTEGEAAPDHSHEELESTLDRLSAENLALAKQAEELERDLLKERELSEELSRQLKESEKEIGQAKADFKEILQQLKSLQAENESLKMSAEAAPEAPKTTKAKGK